jgi:hypothetical protein
VVPDSDPGECVKDPSREEKEKEGTKRKEGPIMDWITNWRSMQFNTTELSSIGMFFLLGGLIGSGYRAFDLHTAHKTVTHDLSPEVECLREDAPLIFQTLVELQPLREVHPVAFDACGMATVAVDRFYSKAKQILSTYGKQIHLTIKDKKLIRRQVPLAFVEYDTTLKQLKRFYRAVASEPSVTRQKVDFVQQACTTIQSTMRPTMEQLSRKYAQAKINT